MKTIKPYIATGNIKTDMEIIEFKGMEFKILWCNFCHSKYIECPRCGNNTCSGGSGENGKCPVCSIAYELMEDFELEMIYGP